VTFGLLLKIYGPSPQAVDPVPGAAITPLQLPFKALKGDKRVTARRSVSSRHIGASVDHKPNTTEGD